MNDPLESALAEWIERTLAGEDLAASAFARERGVEAALFAERVAGARWLVGRHLEARQQTSPKLPTPPFVLGDYEVLEEAGRGAMGVVFHGRAPALHKSVAVKVLDPTRAANAASKERFLREARAAARLDHPNLVRVVAIGEQDGLTYLVMEWIDGDDLASVLRGRAAAPTNHREAALLCAKLARALQHAHENGVVHRDVKPANILVDVAGEPHLVDFGLAKDLEAATLTATGEWLGSPAYASPEQIGGSGVPGPSCDVWSLGVVLYECLTLARPFGGATVESVARHVLSDEPATLRTLNPTVPQELEAICLMALRKDQRARYPSAAAFAADLEAFLRGEPVLARPPTTLQRSLRLVRRHRIAFGLAATSLLGISAILVAHNATRELRASEKRVAEAELYEAQLWREPHEYAARLAAAVASYPEDVDLRLLRALDWLARGRLGSARTDLEAAASCSGAPPDLALARRQVELALRHLAHATLSESDRHELLGLGNPGNQDARLVLVRAYVLGTIGTWEGAEKLFATARFLEPRFAKLAAAGQVWALRHLGRSGEGHAILTPFISAKSPAVAIYQLFDLAWQGQVRAAADLEYRRLRDLHPDSAFNQIADLARLGHEKQDFPAARALVARAQAAPDHAEAESTLLRVLAAYWHVSGEAASAAEVYAKLVLHDAENPSLRGLLGISRLASGDKEAGLRDLAKAAELGDRLPLERDVHWATYRFYAGEVDQAVEHWKGATDLAPRDPTRWRGYAGALTALASATNALQRRIELLRLANDAQEKEALLRPEDARACQLQVMSLDRLIAVLRVRGDPEAEQHAQERERIALEKKALLARFAEELGASVRWREAFVAQNRRKAASSRPTSK